MRESIGKSVMFEIQVDNFEYFVVMFVFCFVFDLVCSGEEFEIFDDFYVIVDVEKVGYVVNQLVNFFRLVVD